MTDGTKNKPFTGIHYGNNLTPKYIREVMNKKFFFNHPQCIYYAISETETIAYYSDPIYAAIVLRKAKNYLGSMGILKDYNSRKYNPKAVTIRIKNNYKQVKDNIEELKGNIIYQSNSKIIVYFQSFYKSAKLLRSLRKIDVKGKFTSKKLIKKKKLLNQI